MNYEQLQTIANAMVQKGKGILAADESTPTCTKRFNSLGVESTESSGMHFEIYYLLQLVWKNLLVV